MSDLGLPLYSAIDHAELAELERQWPRFPRQHHCPLVDDPFLTGNHQMLVADRRRAEICYVMHRGLPEDGLLLHIKTFYPSGAYRLPTGGVHQGETVLDTLAREITEETGLVVGEQADQVKVRRLLGVLSYELTHRTLETTYEFATYHFLTEMPANGLLRPQDKSEMIGGWQWRPAREMGQVADMLENVGTQEPAWADWGRFRALSHRFVVDAIGG